MSKEIDELRRLFKAQFGGDGDMIFSGVVTEVNEDEFTCTIRRDDQVDYFDVRLRGLVNADLQGLALIPKMESVVLVCRIGKSNELFVCQFTEIDKVIFTDNDLELHIDTENIDLKKGDNITLHIDAERLEVVNDNVKVAQEAECLTIESKDIKIDADQITINGGDLGAMVKIAELEKNLKSIKTYVEAMNSALPSAFSAVGAALAAVGANGASAYQGSMAGKMINLEDMADNKVTH